MERKLASIQKVINICPINGADRIQCATIMGWKIVIRKDEFKDGDLCCYFEIDSILPFNPWTDFLKDKKDPNKPIRLRTVKMKGQISQGLAVPISNITQLNGIELSEGMDVTEILGVTKWEPQLPANIAGEVKGVFPHYIPKTDQLRLQSFPSVLEEFKDKEVYITQKVDGTSGTFAIRNGEIDVCSRNLSLKETEHNIYWQMVKQYDIQSKLISYGKNIAIQGECIGEGIQSNRLGLKGHHLYIFDIYDIDNRRYFEFQELQDFCKQFNLPMVKVIYVGTFKWNTIDEMIELANGNYDNGHPQEGIVIHPLKEFGSDALSGRASFKVINNTFLLKTGE